MNSIYSVTGLKTHNYSLIKSGNDGFLMVNKQTHPSGTCFMKSTKTIFVQKEFPNNLSSSHFFDEETEKKKNEIVETHMNQSRRQTNHNRVY